MSNDFIKHAIEVDDLSEITEKLPPSVCALIFQIMRGLTPIEAIEGSKLILADDKKKSFHWFELPEEKELWTDHTQRSLIYTCGEDAEISSRIIIESYPFDDKFGLGIFAKKTDEPEIYSALMILEVELDIVEGIPQMVLSPVSVGAMQPTSQLATEEMGGVQRQALEHLMSALQTDMFSSSQIAEA